MKTIYVLFLSMIMMLTGMSCEKLFNKDDPGELNGDQSPMGEVGAFTESSSMEIAGVSNFSAEVIALKSGVSTFKGSATVKNEILKNLVANLPGISVVGDKVATEGMDFKIATDGIELKSGPGAGIWVKYDSEVGDTYPIGATGKVRTVVEKTGVDDYPLGFMLIKVVKVEEIPSYLKTSGISKITYIANHKFGLVGVKFTLDDNSDVTFPIYNSAVE